MCILKGLTTKYEEEKSSVTGFEPRKMVVLKV